jgi:hypothetical protein
MTIDHLVQSDAVDPQDPGLVGPLLHAPTVSRLIPEAALT